MSCDLAVMTPFLGRTTETAIRRHMLELAPDSTVALALSAERDNGRVELREDRCLILEEAFQYLIRPPSSRREIARILDKARRFFLKHRVKAILSQYLDFSSYFIDLVDDLDIPFVVHAHGADASQRLREPEWRARYASLSKATAIVVLSQAMKGALESTGFDSAKIHVIPCGVDIADGPPPLPAPRRGLTCMTVGRMTAKKAPILLLDAFRRALPGMEGARLDYVGDGPLLSSAHQFVETMGLQDCVTLHGERRHEEVLGLLREADIFVQHCCVDPLSGDAEGLPASILEAMAVGLPVVSTLHAGIPEAVEDGVTGFLVPERDTRAMADRLVELGRDAELRRTMGLHGWHRARRLFSWELERERLLDVLRLLCS